MGERSSVPKFGNWDSEENYTYFFDKARKGKGGKLINPNDPQGNPNGILGDMPPVNAPPFRTSSEPVVRHRTDSPERRDTADSKPVSELSHQQHGDRGINSGEPPRRGSRMTVGSDRSIGHSPLHPHYQPKVASRTGVSSASWENKNLSEGGVTQERPKLRSARGDETTGQGAAVPKFGDWDESNPSSADGYTGIFNKVREERQTGAASVPVMPADSSYSNSQKQDNGRGFEFTKCFCFSWCKK